MQWPAVPAMDNLVRCCACFAQRTLGCDRDEGIDVRIDRFNAPQADLRQFQRRDVLGLNSLTCSKKRWKGQGKRHCDLRKEDILKSDE